MNPEIASKCTVQLPESCRQDSEPVFAAPWQAQAFAMGVSLIEAGLIRWDEWAATLGDEIAHATDHGIAVDGSGYYELWQRALERLVSEKGLVAATELDELQTAWRKAYLDTPHGQPVSLARG